MGTKQSKGDRSRRQPAEDTAFSSAKGHDDVTSPDKPVVSCNPSSSKKSATNEKGKAEKLQRQEAYSESRAVNFFEAYVDKDSDSILAEGVERLCRDLGVDPTDFVVLAWAWKCDVKEACVFSREEFLRGCNSLRADSAKKVQAAFPGLTAELKDEQKFASLYKFAFGFGLEKNETKLLVEMAINLWRLIFSRKPLPYLDDWCEFCAEYPGLKISKDTWNMFLHFSKAVDSDFSNFDEDYAWPSVLDEFVEAQKAKTSR